VALGGANSPKPAKIVLSQKTKTTSNATGTHGHLFEYQPARRSEARNHRQVCASSERCASRAGSCRITSYQESALEAGSKVEVPARSCGQIRSSALTTALRRPSRASCDSGP